MLTFFNILNINNLFFSAFSTITVVVKLEREDEVEGPVISPYFPGKVCGFFFVFSIYNFAFYY